MKHATVFVLVVLGVAVGLFAYYDVGGGATFGDWFTGLESYVGGTKYQFADCLNFAQEAGFSGGDANTAAAIALAESSGNPEAVGDVTLGGSFGLWQINVKAHPEYTASTLYDPSTNAAAAYAIYQAAGNSFTPWTTFNTGAYLSYLPSTSQDSTDVATTDDSGDDDGEDS